MPVDIGVTQGKISEHFMFIVFMRGKKKFSTVSKFVIYADDVTIKFSSETLNTAYPTMNRESAHVEKRLKLNQLTITVTKNEYILFHRGQKTVPQHNFSISIGGKKIVQVDDARILGVFIQ